MAVEVFEYDERLRNHFDGKLREWTRDELIRAALQEDLQGCSIRDVAELEDAHDSTIWRLEGLAYEELVEVVLAGIERTGVVEDGMAWVDPHGYYSLPLPYCAKRGAPCACYEGCTDACWVKV